MPETIFLWAVGSIALWLLIYIFVLFGFILYPEPKWKSQPNVLGLAGRSVQISYDRHMSRRPIQKGPPAKIFVRRR